MKTYLYQLNSQFIHQHPLYANIEFANDWITISDGQLIVNSDYAWDGCSPKRQLLGLVTIGVPDGALRFGKPWLYYVSLIHDVLCQFRHLLPFTQQQVTQIFKEDLQSAKWPMCWLYTSGVNYLGPQDFASN